MKKIIKYDLLTIIFYILSKIIYKHKEIMRIKISKICVIKYCCIGDVLITTPLISELREHFPFATIDYCVGDWSESVLRNNPNLNNIYVVENTPRKLLRKEKYDLVIILDIGFKAIWNGFLLKPKVLAGIDYKSRGFLLDYKFTRTLHDCVHERDVYLGLLESMGFHVKTKNMELFLTEKEISWGAELFIQNKWPAKKTIAIFAGGGNNPGTIMSVKQWGTSKYATLVQQLVKQGYSILLLGGKTDIDINKQLLTLISEIEIKNDVKDLSGMYSLGEIASILKNCRLLITNDSGPLHIAAAVGTPTISIWGPTDPNRLKPFGEEHVGIISEKICSPYFSTGHSENCRPCYRHIIGDFNSDCQTHECMSTINVNVVLNAVERLISDYY